MTTKAARRFGLALLGALFLSGIARGELGEEERARLEKEQGLLRMAQAIEAGRGGFAKDVVQPMWDLGLLYVEWDRCGDAIPVLDHALKVLQAAEGLFNVSQLELFDPLEECYLALDKQTDFARLQDYRILLAERNFAKNDPAMLPMLSQTARWYEQAGYYISSRQLHARAVEVARAAGGDNDLRMVEPLRGIARGFRLEYARGLHPLDLQMNPASPLRNREFDGTRGHPDPRGHKALERAVKILEAHSANRDASEKSGMLVDTLLDLGDWYQITGMPRSAMRAYRKAWEISNARMDGSETLFDKPQAVYVRSGGGVPLLRPPQDRPGFQQYWAELEFNVDRMGRVSDVKVTDTNAPKSSQWGLKDNLRAMPFRPRFVDGEPVVTKQVRQKQKVWLPKQNTARAQ